MPYGFPVFSLISLLYCAIILGVTYFLLYKKIELPLKNLVAFSAGGLTTLIFFEFIPNALSSEKNIFMSVIFILLGLAINALAEMFLLPRAKFLNRLLPEKSHKCDAHDSEHTHYHFMPSSAGCSAVACFILCTFFDGIRLASVFLEEMEAWFLIAVGLLFHLLPESLAVLGIALSAGFSRKIVIRIIGAFLLAFLVGYYLFFFLSHMESLGHFILAFSTGLFMYICFFHFIPMVYKLGIKKWFLLGMLIFFATWQVAHSMH